MDLGFGPQGFGKVSRRDRDDFPLDQQAQVAGVDLSFQSLLNGHAIGQLLVLLVVTARLAVGVLLHQDFDLGFGGVAPGRLLRLGRSFLLALC